MSDEKPVLGTIATPCREKVDTEYMLSLWRLHKPDITATLHIIGWSVAAQRNLCAQGMMGDWLLFIDSDMVFPRDGLERLLAHGEDKDIIGAVCLQKAPPYLAAVWDTENERIDPFAVAKMPAPFECNQLGMAFTLIRKRVFNAMPQPWFELGKGADPAATSEDTVFCLKAKNLGFKVWADPTIKVWHLFQSAVALGPNGPEVSYGTQRWMDETGALEPGVTKA